MAAAAARAIKTVKPHVPLIKFPLRGSPGTGASPAVVAAPTQTSTTTEIKTAPNSSKQVGRTARGSGIDLADLPARYQRRPIPQDEMEYIEKGGQV